jgi:hypothetical protein
MQYQDHPGVRTGFYFTLPGPLLEQVVTEVGEDRFDVELLRTERALSEVFQDHSSSIGFWRGHPISFRLLRPDTDLTDDVTVRETAEALGKSEAEARESLHLGSQRLRWNADVRRGYCGWLMTNRDFLAEHRRIFNDWDNAVTQQGIPTMGPAVRDAQAIPGSRLAADSTGQFLQDFETFFMRWRLDCMPAPYVPQPMGTHMPISDLRPVLGHMRRGGTTFYIPDVYPVPARDTLRAMVEEALRNHHAPDYLTEWFDIVNSDNVAKNQIPRYGRIFEVQHYLRALHSRHSEALRRKKSALIFALAEYFRVSDDTIERDLRFIASRLGSDWYLPSG